MSIMQRTIKKKVQLSGVGIHSGKEVTLTLKPASASTGIVFVRTDRNNVHIPARIHTLKHTERATKLSYHGVSVRTPEHLMAACAGLGVDNLIIEIDNEEVPIMDGSALPFVEALESAGIKKLAKKQPRLVIKRPKNYYKDSAAILSFPADTSSITYYLSYPQSFIGSQVYTYHFDEETFKRDIAPARTYGFYKDVKTLLDKGLAQGGSLDNALVIGEDDYMNKPRFENELVRHKLLDLIGDLWVLGHPIKGHIIGITSGHTHTMTWLKKLFDEEG